jgi:hypothetical protein
MPLTGTGAQQMAELGRQLKAAGNEGQRLKRNLSKKIKDAAEPLAKKIGDVEHLKPYMPDRYAAVLAEDISVRVRNFYSANPRSEVRAQAREHKRKVVMLDAGVINHPIFAQGPRKTWSWSNRQTKGMKAGFFTDVVKDATPQIRAKVLQAMAETAKQIAP